MNEDNNNPNPNPAPTSPEPAQAPAPETAPVASTPMPEPAAAPEPTSTPMPEPAVAPEPTPASISEPAPDTPNADSVVEPTPAPATEGNSQPAKDPDEALVEAYIGDNYDKISTRAFNIPAFFFPGFYLIFRKRYLWGIIVFIINIICSNMATILGAMIPDAGMQIGQTISSIGSVVVGVAVAFGFNKLYIKSIHKKIEKLRAENPGISNDELKGICSSKGGTSVPGLIVSIFSMGIIFVASTIVMFLVAMGQAFVSSMENANVTMDGDGTIHISGGTGASSTNSSDNVYNGSLSYDNDYEDLIDVTMPKVFKISDVSASFGYQYKPTDEVGDCSVNIHVVKNFTDASKMIVSMADYNEDDLVGSVESYEANDLTWDYFVTEDTFGREYNLATNVDRNVVYVEYQMDEDLYDVCEGYLWDIMDSIEAK